MAVRQDKSLEISLLNIDNFRSSAEIRTYLLLTWSQEEPATKFRYFVETLSNGDRIYLERPGRLNKGCDFVIYIENLLLYKNGNDKPPKHDFIFDDLRQKKLQLRSNEWTSLIHSIEIIHRSGSFTNAITAISNLPNPTGHSYELLLKLIRWFFIEQDITYWSGEQRDMFYEGINNI